MFKIMLEMLSHFVKVSILLKQTSGKNIIPFVKMLTLAKMLKFSLVVY